MSAKNQRIQCKDIAEFRRVVEEVHGYLGRDVDTNEATLEIVVLTLPRHYKKKSERESKLRRQRQERDSAYDLSSDEDYGSYEDRY